MKILDIISWISEEEICLKKLEQTFRDYRNGSNDNSLIVLTEVPENTNENIVEARNELVKEGKQIVYIFKDETIIAVIGYKE